MSSESEDENGDELSFLPREPTEHEDVSSRGKRIVWANSYSYTHRNVLSLLTSAMNSDDEVTSSEEDGNRQGLDTDQILEEVHSQEFYHTLANPEIKFVVGSQVNGKPYLLHNGFSYQHHIKVFKHLFLCPMLIASVCFAYSNFFALFAYSSFLVISIKYSIIILIHLSMVYYL
uniref:Uncharacterized protein n=1 Tax=Ditylenchus dipsaci TaxID=166011 RepID=A0A915E1C8_9BILA